MDCLSTAVIFVNLRIITFVHHIMGYIAIHGYRTAHAIQLINYSSRKITKMSLKRVHI